MAEYPDGEVPLLPLFPALQRLLDLTEAHKKYGLTRSQVIVFTVLTYRDSVTMGEMAQYISSSKEQATRAVAALCENGFVERFERPENRTHVYIRFTEQGREYMRQIGRTLDAEIRARRSTTNTRSPDVRTASRGIRVSPAMASGM